MVLFVMALIAGGAATYYIYIKAKPYVAAAKQVADKYNLLNPVDTTEDPAVIEKRFRESFNIGIPKGYRGAFTVRTDFLQLVKSDVFALVPKGADTKTLFENGSEGLKFNPGPHTLIFANDTPVKGKQKIERYRRDILLMSANPAVKKIFIKTGGRKVAAYLETTEAQGQKNTFVQIFLDGGKLIAVVGPKTGFKMSVVKHLAKELAAKHAANELLFSHVKAEPRDPNHPCGISGLRGDFVVEAVGVERSQTKLEQGTIDPNNDESYLEKVVIGATKKPVVLLLMANRPTLWRIEQTESARIAGVIAGGSNAQRVYGLRKGVPLKTNDPNIRTGCPTFSANSYEKKYLKGIEDGVWDIFRKPIEKVHTQKYGDGFRVGTVSGPAKAHGNLSIEAHLVDPSKHLLPGKLGLAQLVKKGVLRTGTENDMTRWTSRAQKRGKKVEEARVLSKYSMEFSMNKVYFVKKESELPPGMYGAHSAVFILAPGVPMPEERGHNTILSDDGGCVGSCSF